MIEARISGIPCLIEVTHYAAAVPGRLWGAPENCYPDEPEEIEFEVCDRRGRSAPWLERKMTKDDRLEIERLICENIKRPYDDRY
jgi:hypothetical protein